MTRAIVVSSAATRSSISLSPIALLRPGVPGSWLAFSARFTLRANDFRTWVRSCQAPYSEGVTADLRANSPGAVKAPRRRLWCGVALAIVMLNACGKDEKPISQMNCTELHRYYDDHITPNLDPDASLAVQRKATKDAGDLNRRIDVDIDGGCPGSEDW